MFLAMHIGVGPFCSILCACCARFLLPPAVDIACLLGSLPSSRECEGDLLLNVEFKRLIYICNVVN